MGWGLKLSELRRAAKIASGHAYCPYSRFPVGAAVLTEDELIFSGCNVENASFGLTVCAERNAIFQAIAHGQRRILAIVIYTPTARPTAPCGACRQVLNEFGAGATVVCGCNSDLELRKTASELLPEAFGPENL